LGLNSFKIPKFFRKPRLSVVIPTFNRPRELSLCLEGFAQQTASREQFELIVVDDGSLRSMKSVCKPFEDGLQLDLLRLENSGPSVARNTAIERARGDFLLLYDDDLRPFPDVVERCIEFHQLHPEDSDISLLHFVPEKEFAADPLTVWGFPLLYPFPAKDVVAEWRWFWSGSSSCKKSIFSLVKYSPEYRSLEDTELALRLSCRMDLRVHFEKRPAGVMTRRLTLKQILARSYSCGYHRYKMTRDYPGEVGSLSVPYKPDPDLIDPERVAALLATAESIAKEPMNAARFRMTSAIWTRLEVNARAEGWIAARNGQTAQPPGTAGKFIKDLPDS
jgi:glycosyltransferase involved in cell wall biosynthesis